MKVINKINFLLFVSLKWGLSRLRMSIKKVNKPVHILFCLVDHYEPGTGGVSKEIEISRVKELKEKYPSIANAHRDYCGNIPKRTWFFPPHYHRNYNLRNLVSLCEKGYGEIELHLHHGKHRPDTEENLRNTILKCVEDYKKFGIFGENNGNKKYGFIHGNWALDNSINGKFCGVNNELQVLRDTGCYADFTFPSGNESNPSQINSIYYAIDDPKNPKSYNYGKNVIKNGTKYGDIMMIQGPLYPFFLSNKITSIRYLGDAIDGEPAVNKKRIDAWIKTGICVEGKNDFIFVKTHTHGATDSHAVLGQEIEQIFEYLESKYNDGTNYILHYVTARELYNIIKAIESGVCISDPEVYRNYLIDNPKYDSSIDISEASDILKEMIAKTYWG